MGRFDRFFDTVKKVADPQIEAGDESAIAESPRNWLTDKVNTALPEDYQIPTQTVAEDKQHMINLPEQMAGATMGSIATPGRFSRVLGPNGMPTKNIGHADIMSHPEMVEFLKNSKAFKASNPHPSQYDSAKQALINKIRGQ